MDKVFCEELIICSKARRGNGVGSPIRVITEVFDKQGNIIADSDPYYLLPEEMLEFLKWCSQENIHTPTYDDTYTWAINYRRGSLPSAPKQDKQK